MLDLLNNNDAYFYGLLLTDGNCNMINKNKGRITLELKDEDIIQKLFKLYGGNISQRFRDTNFKKNYQSFVWRNSKMEFRNELFLYGFPVGEKEFLQKVPNINYNENGFWRGVIDGNGSLGLTKDEYPFLSLTTKSEFLKNSYLEFLNKNIYIKKIVNRNKRDNIYNILIYKEDAQNIANMLYKDSNLYIQRKFDKYLIVIKWIRPLDMSIRSWLSCHEKYNKN